MEKRDGTREGTAAPERRQMANRHASKNRRQDDCGPDCYKEMSDGAGEKVRELVENQRSGRK